MRDRQSIEQAKEEEHKYKLHLLEKQKNDLQITLQVNSIVRVQNSNGGGGGVVVMRGGGRNWPKLQASPVSVGYWSL